MEYVAYMVARDFGKWPDQLMRKPWPEALRLIAMYQAENKGKRLLAERQARAAERAVRAAGG